MKNITDYMKEKRKKELYDKIMSNVSREVKKVLRNSKESDSALNENEKTSMKKNTVVINWEDPIDIKKFDQKQLSNKEKKIVQTEKVIYIYEGCNIKNKEALDVGQTKRPLAERHYEHTNNRDFLEGYPYDQVVYCGKVACESVTVKSELLNQVEGAIIQYINQHKKNQDLCNIKKLEDYKKPYDIERIENKGLKSEFELAKVLPKSFKPEE